MKQGCFRGYRQDRHRTRGCRKGINLNYTTDKTCSMGLLECNCSKQNKFTSSNRINIPYFNSNKMRIVMGELRERILLLMDNFILLLNEITVGKRILNEFDKDRLESWKERKLSDVNLGDDWPDDFEEEWG